MEYVNEGDADAVYKEPERADGCVCRVTGGVNRGVTRGVTAHFTLYTVYIQEG